jgi:exosortase/archaeosortase family protein
MRRIDVFLLASLAAFAAFIWARDLRWATAPADTLPILIGLPLTIWLGAPWRLAAGERMFSAGAGLLAAGLFAAGIGFDSTLALAASWTAVLWTWMSARLADGGRRERRSLLVLPLMSFPWVVTDLERVSWWFRLSGAAASAAALRLAGFDVEHYGTGLVVNGFSASVEPACSGMNGLQALLVAGTALAYLRLKHTPLFWWNLPLLAALAWVANFSRVALASAGGALAGPDSARRWIGPSHEIAGWAILALSFAGVAVFFNWQARQAARGDLRVRLLAGPWAEVLLIAYASYRASGLLVSWSGAPFERLAWLAFVVWIGALAYTAARPVRIRAAKYAWAAAAFVFLGDIAQVNAAYQAGLALAVVSLAPPRGRLLWAAGAVSWTSGLGWIASRLPGGPLVLPAVRLAVAAVATGWTIWRQREPISIEPILPDVRHDAVLS